MLFYSLRKWPSTTILQGLYTLQKKIFQLKKNRFILIACFPRSASNFLANLLSEPTGYNRITLKLNHGFFHDTIYLPKLIDQMQRKTIVAQHLRATSVTRSIITDLKIKPVILVRNIFDVIISFDDYITKRGYSPLDPDRKDLTPEFCREYVNFEDSKKYDYLIDVILPWYITFYVSWYHYTFKTKAIEAYWVKYEDLITSPGKILSGLFDFYNLSIPASKVDSVLQKNEKVNFNIGIIGRGHKLSDIQKEKIRRMTAYYPDINFDMMGL